jgi:hypothetical protein
MAKISANFSFLAVIFKDANLWPRERGLMEKNIFYEIFPVKTFCLKEVDDNM